MSTLSTPAIERALAYALEECDSYLPTGRKSILNDYRRMLAEDVDEIAIVAALVSAGPLLLQMQRDKDKETHFLGAAAALFKRVMN